MNQPICKICGHPVEEVPYPHFHIDPDTGEVFHSKDHTLNGLERAVLRSRELDTIHSTDRIEAIRQASLSPSSRTKTYRVTITMEDITNESTK